MSTPAVSPDREPVALRLAVIGSGRHAADLAAQHPWGRPFVGRHAGVTAWAPLDGDAGAVAALARRTGARVVSGWREAVEADDVDAVVLLVPVDRCAGMIRHAVSVGRAVLCPSPLAASARELEVLADDVIGHDPEAVVVAAGALCHTPAGRSALAILAGGSLGRIESVYAGVHHPTGGETAGQRHLGLPEAGWDVLDLLVTALPAPPARVYAHGAALFGAGGAHDTLVSIVRLRDDTVITLEAAASLPPTMAIPAAGRIEVEIIAAAGTLRLEPYETDVTVHGARVPAGAARRDWVEPPVAGMVDALLAAIDRRQPVAGTFEVQRRLVALGDALAASLASGEAVEA